MIPTGRAALIRVAALVIGLMALVLITGLAVKSCDKRRSQAAQSRVERSQADAASNSAADAIGTVAASGDASAASEELTRSNEKDIRHAQGSNAPVNPSARDSGLRALCMRRAYSADPKCRVFRTNP